MDLIGQFFAILACIIPGAYCIGVIPSISLFLLISQLGHISQEKRKGKSLEGKRLNSIKQNLLACWGGLARGGLVGVLLTRLWLLS